MSDLVTVTFFYRDTIKLPDHITIATARACCDKIREMGASDLDAYRGTLTIGTTADDLWQLREVLDDIRAELEMYDVPFEPQRGLVVAKPSR